MTTDPLDQPEDDSYGLVYPFVVCQSQGGPYDDDSFVAGFALGRIDQALDAAELLGAKEMRFTVRSALAKQCELVGMARGFPVVEVVEVGETDQHAAMPEWSYATFRTEAAS